MVNFTGEERLTRLTAIVQLVLGTSEAPPVDIHLSELGMDSLAVVNAVLEIEQQFDITLSDHDMMISNFSTIEDISKMVEKNISENRSRIASNDL